MKKKLRAETIASLLDKYFPHPQIPLLHKDPFTLLVAVLLSAQCTDAKVNQVTPQLFELADTPEKMAACKIEQIKEIISPCGLANTKAKALISLSKDLIEYHRSKVPDSFEELEKLSGVGHKTASVVMVQAFHHPAFPVDTHIHRSAHRWKLSSGKSVKQTESDLKRLFPKGLWGKVHLQIILYARQFCPARCHNIGNCPICMVLERMDRGGNSLS